MSTTPSDVAASSRTSGTGFVLAAALAVSVLLAFINGLWWLWWAMLTFDGNPDGDQYCRAAGVCLTSALLILALTAPVTRIWTTPRWILALATLISTPFIAVAAALLATKPPGPGLFYVTPSVWDGVADTFVVGTWPLIAVALLAAGKFAYDRAPSAAESGPM